MTRHSYLHRRRLPALAAFVAIVFAALAGSAPVRAQEDGEIRNGTAKAVALVSRVAPGVGNLELGMTAGTSVTQITNSLAQATSQTVDLGLIGSSLTAEGCRGSSSLQPEDLPQPTAVDNRDGDASATRDESGTSDAPFGMGRMYVEAFANPVASRAVTQSSGVTIDAALSLGGGESSARTAVLPGRGREAEAKVTSSVEIAGVVHLDGLRWNAYHRTGVEREVRGIFEVGAADVGGLPFPSDDVGALETAVNQALVPLGVTLDFPEVETVTEPTDFLRVTPLQIEIRDSPAGATIFGPVLDATREQRGQLFDTLVEQICELASVLLVGDITVSVISGTGFLTIELGGVEVSSGDFVLQSPFGAPIVPPGQTVAPRADTSAPQGTASPAPSGPVAPSTPTASSDGSPPPTTTPGQLAAPSVPASSGGALEEFCESVHPNRDACGDGAAYLVGALALLGTLGVAGADLARQRRRMEDDA